MKRFIKPVLFGILFVVFTVLVKFVDVLPVGPENSLVGFAGVNIWVHQLLGTNSYGYELTQMFGVLALLAAAAFALLGLVQLIKGKSLRKVDSRLLWLGLVYIIVIILYVLFEKLAINYRPVILDEGLEPSYPSTHTMLILTIFGTAYRASGFFIKNETTKGTVILTTIRTFCLAVMALTIVGRLLSGVHWFTDIVGGVLVSLALITLYQSLTPSTASKEAANE
ncbi:MAG: phosphatase PAP2 family protein [Treponema sp.]|nr:phosphatase PAP2 family protein [Treponema sp.]